MEIFRRKKKIHLSPKLARTIGKKNKSPWHYLSELIIMGTLVGALILFVSIRRNEQSLNQSQTYEDNSESSVLGAQSEKILSYQVESGDTLTDISQKFGVYWTTIVEENELEPPYTLSPGQTLRIPLPRTQ